MLLTIVAVAILRDSPRLLITIMSDIWTHSSRAFDILTSPFASRNSGISHASRLPRRNEPAQPSIVRPDGRGSGGCPVSERPRTRPFRERECGLARMDAPAWSCVHVIRRTLMKSGKSGVAPWTSKQSSMASVTRAARFLFSELLMQLLDRSLPRSLTRGFR